MQEAPITVLSASSGLGACRLIGASEDGGSIMTSTGRDVCGGVDTHGRTHHAAAVDGAGRLLGDAEFAATSAGYRALLAWLTAFGRLVKVGVEGTGTYGAGLARHLAAQDVVVIEVDRPDRKTRRRQGKSDPIDAIAAARAVLAGTATGAPKTRTGPVEAIRALRVARRGAVKARTAALNQLHGLLTAAPEPLRAELAGLPTTKLVARCAGFRIDPNRLLEPVVATKAALRAIARRVHALDEEITLADTRLRPATATVAPRTRRCSVPAPTWPGSCWSPPGTTPNGCAARPRWPTWPGSARCRPAPGAPTGIASTAEVTAPPTPRSTASCSAACATTSAPAPTSNAAPPKD